MIRRWLVLLVAAGGLLLFAAGPVSATTGSGGLQVSTTDPVAGQGFQAVVDGTGCRAVRLTVHAPSGSVTIDGRSARTAHAAGGGQVVFEVAITAPGTVRLSSACKGGASNDGYQANNRRDMVEVVVARKPAVAPTQAARPRPAPAAVLPQQGLLPHVGADGVTTLLLGGGVVLVIAGGVAVATRRGRGRG